MTPPPSLSGAHLRTFQTIFQHPISHNLGWHDVHALFRQLGQVEEQMNGNFKLSYHGQTLVVPPSHQKDISTADDLMRIRHFLEHAAPAPAAVAATPADARWLLVINHREARIFRSCAPGTASSHFLPSHPSSESHGYSGLVRGQEKPADAGFFGPIVAALKDAGQILIFGSGTGGGSEMDRFVAWTKTHHAALAGRITGTQVVDEHHLTDTQLLATARQFGGAAAAT